MRDGSKRRGGGGGGGGGGGAIVKYSVLTTNNTPSNTFTHAWVLSIGAYCTETCWHHSGTIPTSCGEGFCCSEPQKCQYATYTPPCMILFARNDGIVTQEMPSPTMIRATKRAKRTSSSPRCIAERTSCFFMGSPGSSMVRTRKIDRTKKKLPPPFPRRHTKPLNL